MYLGILTFLFLLCLLSAYLILVGRVGYKIKILALIILSVTLVVFIRMGFSRYFTTTDESYYLSLIIRPMWYKTAIVSGYMTPLLLRLFHEVLSNPVDIVIWNSMIFMVLYVLVIFVSYRQFGFLENHAVIAILLLFMTRMYLWPTIETRPQQIGLLVGLILVVLTVKWDVRPSKMLLLVLMYVLLIFSHVLSFILYSSLILGYLIIKVVFTDDEGTYFKKMTVTLVSVLVSWAFFVVMPYSYYLLKNMTWILNDMMGNHITVRQFSFISLVLLALSSIGIYIFIKNFPSFLKNVFRSFWNSLIEMLRGIPSITIWMIAVFGILGSILFQIILEGDIYSGVYGSSLVSFLFFQLGNIAFALFYVDGMLSKLYQRKISDFEILSLLWIFISVEFLVLSFFMPEGKIWTFRNWFLRVVQYFVVFAAPIAAYSLPRTVLSRHKFKSILRSLLIPLLISMLIFVSVLNTARIPSFYNYDVVWSPDLVSLCERYPTGFYYPRTEGSIYYMDFAIRNLIIACGGELLQARSGNFDRILVSSDRFYVYSSNYVPLSLSEFRVVSKTPVLCGGNSKTLMYAASLLGVSKILPVSDEGGCFSYYFSSADSVILIGGRVSNPCVDLLESSGAVLVRLGVSMVKTPVSIYKTSISDPWWDSKEGLFVIQAIKYKNVPVLIIEGTNLDATMAALYYYENVIYPNPRGEDSIHYIVGKWEETDNTVISIAKLAPQDINGFSLGDKITILEKG